MKQGRRKTAVIHVRVLPKDHADVKKKAKRAGKNLSTFILDLVRAA